MAYEEYDYYNEPTTGSLKESLYQILNGLQDRTKLREAGTSLKEALQLTPNVTESLGRGGVAQAIGTSGDLRDLSNTINSYLPKSVRNFTKAAEFLANPYATAIQQTAPTTEETLDFVPRVSAPYEGYKQHETLGEYVAPALGYFGGKAAKAYGNYVGPTAYKAVEDYLTKTGGILNAIEPGETKKIQEIASAIDELGFHSPLENAILKIQQPKGTGDQFLKQLEKTPGVKTEELDVTGVKQYLLDHPTVTKQELSDQMASNRLKLEQKVLTKQEEIANNEADYELQGGDVHHDEDYIRSMADDLHHDMKNDPVIRDQEKQALLEADPERYADYETNPYTQARLEKDIDGVLYEHAKTKSEEMYYESPMYHHYDDYGYDIYGNDEMGYTVRGPNGEHVDIGDQYDIADVGHELRMHHLDRDILDYTGNEEDFAKYSDYVLPGKHENYREMLTTLPRISEYDKAVANMEAFKKTINERLGKPRGGWDFEELTPQEQMKYDILNERGLRASKDKPTYESGHFDEPNILAHTRLNDRIINGKKTLMVEEIQSDWHQAGRRKGYTQPISEERKMEIRLEIDKIERARKELYENRGKQVIGGQTVASSFDSTLAYLERLENEFRNELKGTTGVPDAPFKKNWHELMMKQILNEAVKGDYDAIALTTGKQQAERYNLSKQIDSLDLVPAEEGVKQFVLSAYKDGRKIINKEVNEDELPDLIGKEAAKKLLEQETTKLHRPEGVAHGNPNVFKGRELKGLELDVGGEPMKKFYDEIIPNFINKYGKKYGIGVKKANIDTVKNQFSDFQNWAINKDPSLHTSFIFDSWSNKDDLFKEWSKSGQKPGEEVHFVELTNVAKKDIKSKGQPLFSGIGLAPAPLLMGDEEDN